MRYPCYTCGKSVTTELPDDSIIRAALTCPECLELDKTEAQLAVAVKALEVYADDRHWKSHMSVTDGIVEALTTDDRFGCDRAKCALAEIEAMGTTNIHQNEQKLVEAGKYTKDDVSADYTTNGVEGGK